MRIAHLIIGHKNPLQLSRLARSLEHPDFDIYIHVDKKVDIFQFRSLNGRPNVFFIQNRVKVNWGGNSTLMAIIRSMEEILKKEKKYHFINLLSAQDYPLKSSNDIVGFFSSNIGCNFISFDASKESKWWKEASARYERYHFTDLPIKGKYYLQNVVNFFTGKRQFPGGLKLFGDNKSAWWTITSDCASYVVQQVLENKQLRSFLKYCWGTDEFVVATIIMNSPFRNKAVNDNLRYIDWSDGNPNPKVLVKSDFAKLTTSGMLFARKFDIHVDSAILDSIDQYMQEVSQ